MSYTPPSNVQTKTEAVLALASTVADEDKTNLGDGSVNSALDVLADVLAEQDVEVPPTNAGAILALSKYVKGGGSGGASYDVVIKNDVKTSAGNLQLVSGDFAACFEKITAKQPIEALVYNYNSTPGANSTMRYMVRSVDADVDERYIYIGLLWAAVGTPPTLQLGYLVWYENGEVVWD